MTNREILDEFGYGEVLLFDGPDFDSAIVGVPDEMNAVYDYEKMVKQLMKDNNISRLEAIEFIEANTIRAIPYFEREGPPPIIINTIESMLAEEDECDD